MSSPRCCGLLSGRGWIDSVVTARCYTVGLRIAFRSGLDRLAVDVGVVVAVLRIAFRSGLDRLHSTSRIDRQEGCGLLSGRGWIDSKFSIYAN